MRKYKHVKKTVAVIKEVRCNKCGKRIDIKEHEDGCYISGCSVEMRHGYGSKYDGDVLRFDLCDECSNELAQSFKHGSEIKQEF